MKRGSARSIAKNSTKRIALIAVMAATLIGGKIALASLPNIEIVTLLCALYGYVLGPIGIASIGIFIPCEILIWGPGPWVVSYCVYWPLVCVVFYILRKAQVKNRWLLTLTAAVLTVFFGFFAGLVDVGLFMGFYDNFWLRFSIYYMRGIGYCAIHVACNIALFSTAFVPIKQVLVRQYAKLKLTPDIKPRRSAASDEAALPLSRECAQGREE
ncbi:MAG: hypothetical protein LBH24_05890 [Clostridiales bacterium]|jgi:energy-coupling factor transport system substrate-specific component|nr:hypothetical protein [Clostridiales bacterium]